MQLVNFCLEPFVQHVECGSVCADGLSVHNLMSTDALLRSRGCQVEHFIRPPLYIQFHFSAPLHVACILIQPSLTEHTETRIEVAGSLHSPGVEGYQYKPCCGSALVKGENSVLVLRNKVFERKFGEIMFSPDLSVLGSCMDSRLMCLPLIEQPLKHSNVLYSLKCLKVAITQFTGHKPAAIKTLEVWGTPSSNCSAHEGRVTGRLIAGLRVRPPSSRSSDCMGVYNSHRQHESSPLEENLVDHKIPGSLACDNELPSSQEGYFKGGIVPAEYSFSAANSSGQHMSNVHLEGCCQPTGMREDRHTKGLVGGRQFQGTHTQAPTLLDQSNSSWAVGKPCFAPEMPVGRLESLWDRQAEAEQCIKGRGNSEARTTCSLSLGLPGISAPLQGVGADERETLNKDVTKGGASGGTGVRCSGGQDAIPEKFLDEITYEVMAVPMLLPSGHYVDKNTLDKLLHTDAVYGRPPSDPFTGKATITRMCYIIWRMFHHCLPLYGVNWEQVVPLSPSYFLNGTSDLQSCAAVMHLQAMH